MSQWNKMSINSLKSYLKSIHMTQSGDKGTLIHRCTLYQLCIDKHITIQGKHPCTLSSTELKKTVAQMGLSPIGTSDELLTSLIQHLAQNTTETIDSNHRNSNEIENKLEKQNRSNPSAIEIAKRVLELNDADDFEGILNIAGGNTITKSSPIAVMRKAYLKLSLVIHPDKLQRSFDQATHAFQALVRAFERLSQPEVTDDVFMQESSKTGKKGSSKSPSGIARSNEGCYRTRVKCPRCKQCWSEGTLDGNPDYFYNFLMTGLKTYTCSTCLCEFGCVTAIHECPFCSKFFEYSPQDYHRKITCGNSKCNKEFGFYMFHVSNRVMTEMKRSVKEEQERYAKIHRTKQRRAARSISRDQQTAEAAFVMGLEDCCPRCGEGFEGYPDEEAQRHHMMNCTDENKHKKHRKTVQAAKEHAAAAEQKRDKQAQAQSLASWEFLGGKTSQLYLLNNDQLKDIAQREGLATSDADSREDLVSKIGDQRRGRADQESEKGRKRIKTANSSSALVVGNRRISLSPEDLPPNMHSMTVAELRVFCASYGVAVPKKLVKSEIIELIEGIAFDD
mmetsp:Transcript_2682/g.4029  ORF Transcript_2682/g.4029 Transcript_2682/m.4029 type:complete len:562 (-) Transcript_2682:123-1808(-)